MALLLKRAKMPKCCNDCFALGDDNVFKFCRITEESVRGFFPTHSERLPHCPLQEIKNLRKSWQSIREMDGYEDRCENCQHLFSENNGYSYECEKWLEPVWNEDDECWECEKFERAGIEYE